MEPAWRDIQPIKKKRRGRKIVLILLCLLYLPAIPIACSYVECPFMPYYRSHWPGKTAMMKYRAAQAKAKGKKFELKYQPVPLKAISRSLPKAVIAAEDGNFYEHDGFDMEAIKQAYEYNHRRGRTVRGGSTLSQQLAKNLWLSPERSWWRKLIEAILTWRMERTLSKDRIMELYLNVIEWGNGIFGVKVAAAAYFHTSPASLTASQAALLVAAIPSPLRSNPGRPSAYLQRRQASILSRIGRRNVDPKLLMEPAEGPPEAAAPATTTPAAPTPAAGDEIEQGVSGGKGPF